MWHLSRIMASPSPFLAPTPGSTSGWKGPHGSRLHGLECCTVNGGWYRGDPARQRVPGRYGGLCMCGLRVLSVSLKGWNEWMDTTLKWNWEQIMHLKCILLWGIFNSKILASHLFYICFRIRHLFCFSRIYPGSKTQWPSLFSLGTYTNWNYSVKRINVFTFFCTVCFPIIT